MGDRLNTRKSKALAVGGWITPTDTQNIPYHAEIKILGVTFASTFERSMNNSWVNVTGKVRSQASHTYERNLSPSQRIRYTQTYLLVKMTYGPGVPGTHDVYPTIDDCCRVVHMEGSNVPGTNIDSTESEETRRLGLNWHRGEMSSSPDGPNVGTTHEKELCSSDMAPGVESGWIQGEPT